MEKVDIELLSNILKEVEEGINNNLVSETSIKEAIKHFESVYARKEEAKKIHKDIKDATDILVNLAGVGFSWQDAEGTVFQVSKGDEWQPVAVKFYEIKHTRRKKLDEKQGSLGLDAARKLGYTVE